MIPNTLPFTKGVVLTPHDTNDIADYPTRALYVGGAGNLNVDLINGSTVLLSGVPAGATLHLAARRVKSTSTTATLIVALF